MIDLNYIDEVEVNGHKYRRVVAPSNRVLVRCRNAGVWVGTLESRDEINTVLKNANRIWRWRGANTLSEVAKSGVNREEYTRIAEEVVNVTLTTSDTCEIIPVAEGINLSKVWNE